VKEIFDEAHKKERLPKGLKPDKGYGVQVEYMALFAKDGRWGFFCHGLWRVATLCLGEDLKSSLFILHCIRHDKASFS
jgi:hypothetical protein